MPYSMVCGTAKGKGGKEQVMTDFETKCEQHALDYIKIHLREGYYVTAYVDKGEYYWEKVYKVHACKVSDTPQTDCDKCIWSVCNYNKVDWDANTPQTELTAKCLNCRNAKACKENHWDGCIYEPQTDCNDIYPLVIIKDRYTGVYSNGKYTAWNMFFEDIPKEIDEDDVTCHNFWHSYNGIVGLGETPSGAIEDLRKKLNVERNE